MDIYISNLPDNLEENHLRILFEPFGKVILTRIVRDNWSGRSKGFGFVNMPNAIEAKRAIEDMDGRELAGKVLVVTEAVKGYSKSSPHYDPGLESPNRHGVKKSRAFYNPNKDSSPSYVPDPDNNEKIDLEVKDEADFSKETEGNGFVRIRFKR